MARVEVERRSDDLRRRVWEFALFDFPRVVLDVYREEDRPSTRHRKWRTLRRYQRLRYGNFHGEKIREEPEVPGDVLEEALERYREQIAFARWERR